MLTTNERWILAGVWAGMIASTVGGTLLVHDQPIPERRPAGPVGSSLPPRDSAMNKDLARLGYWQTVSTARPPATEYAACLKPEVKVLGVGGSRVEIEKVLPWPIYSGTVGIDRASLTWNLEEPRLTKTEKREQRRSPPSAIVIHRAPDGGEVDRIFVLGPKETCFVDTSVEHSRSYRYWVSVRGQEGVQSWEASTVRVVDKEGIGSAEGVVPEWIRVRLIGGDRGHAILVADSFDPRKGQWETSRHLVTPGQAIGKTGWTLDALRFDKFTLNAVATDDRGHLRDLSTK